MIKINLVSTDSETARGLSIKLKDSIHSLLQCGCNIVKIVRESEKMTSIQIGIPSAAPYTDMTFTLEIDDNFNIKDNLPPNIYQQGQIDEQQQEESTPKQEQETEPVYQETTDEQSTNIVNEDLLVVKPASNEKEDAKPKNKNLGKRIVYDDAE